MSLIKCAITAVAGYVPEDVITNHDLEKMVETDHEWIVSRTGIEKRHILKDPDKATSDMAVEAAKILLDKRGIDAKEIEMIIVATVTADYPFPDTANIVAHKLGATNAFGYDINAACSGFLFSLMTGSKFVETGTYKKVLVIGADQMSSIVNYKDRSTCILFGDGAGAVLLEPKEEGNHIEDAILRGDGSGRPFLFMKAGGSMHPASPKTVAADEHYAFQEGRSVFKRAILGMSSCVKDLMDQNELKNDDVAYIVAHQANKRIILGVADALNFSHEKVLLNIQEYGNTTAATIPLVLRDFEDRFKPGDRLILTAFGGGFTWGAISLKWAI